MEKKYKIVVLSDLRNSTTNILKSTVSLAKMIHGEIELFHVKSLTNIVEKENQLSAMRTLNKEYSTIHKKIQKFITPISKEYETHIQYNFSFGNVKNEIGKYLEASKPDIIVLGKRRLNPLHFMGENITDFVLKKHAGVLMIASHKNVLEPNTVISLGLLNNLEKSLNIDFAESLIENAQKPLKSFNVVKSVEGFNAARTPSDRKTVEFVFQKTDNSVKNLSKYISKNNINLLCVNRANERAKNKANLIKSDLKDLINTLNVSLLVSGKQQYTLQ